MRVTLMMMATGVDRARRPGTTRAEPPFRQLGDLGSFVASNGVAEEARTRGFAPPAFAGLAFVDGTPPTQIRSSWSPVKCPRRAPGAVRVAVAARVKPAGRD